LSFSGAWLRLREPYDAAARNPELTGLLADWARTRGKLEIVDLGSGTASNLRWLAPRLPSTQRWRLVELDPALAAAGAAMLPAGPARAYVEGDLATGLEALLTPPVEIVTCSALLDLVSLSWLRRLVARVRELRAALLTVLSFDGRIELHPSHPLDAEVIALVDRHQRTDKGFGPALGPTATDVLVELLRGHGAGTLTRRSDWELKAEAGSLLKELLAGYAEAAVALEPGSRVAVEAWLDWRLARVAAGEACARVGHQDLLWLPD
jgi:hypothetical protein